MKNVTSTPESKKCIRYTKVTLDSAKKDRRNGMPVVEITKKYGMSASYIHSWVIRRTKNKKSSDANTPSSHPYASLDNELIVRVLKTDLKTADCVYNLLRSMLKK